MNELNAKLQSKKNEIRKELAEKGVLQRGAVNTFDRYKYFSEAQYKELFTGLLSSKGIELTTSVIDVVEFTGTEKMPFGRRITMEIKLTDIETGFSESSLSLGEGTDKGDKAIYKAMTGALKYFFANNFIVATGDDPEKDSEDTEPTHITKDDMDIIEKQYGARIADLLESRGLTALKEMSYKDGRKLVDELRAIAKKKQSGV